MEYKKKQRKEDIGNVNIFVRKYKLALFLIVGIVVFVLLSSSQVYAEDNSLQGINCEQSVEDISKQAKAICAARYPGDDSAQFFCSVNLLAACEDYGDAGSGGADAGSQLPFEEYNSPPDLSGGQRAEQQGTPPPHSICPSSVGNLTLDLSYYNAEIRIMDNCHYVGCNYVGTLEGHYQTNKLASFSLLWAEDDEVSKGIKKQLCRPDFIGWEEWSDNGKAASVTYVYLHGDLEEGLKDELKSKIKVGLGNAEARALTCPGEIGETEETCEDYCKKEFSGISGVAVVSWAGNPPNCECSCEYEGVILVSPQFKP